MSARGGKPLRIVAAGFAASALLVVLQTLAFQLLPWDSPASPGVVLALRIAFLSADVTLLVALSMLARAEPAQRGLLAIGAALGSFAVLSGLLGLGTKALGEDSRAIHAIGQAMSGAEPAMSMGTALLTTLALGALAKPHGSKATARARLVTIAIVVLAALSLGLRAVGLLDGASRSLAAAWASWLLEVTRPALVALLALSLVRAIGRAGKQETRPEGPYRAAGEGAPAPAAKEPLDAATIASLRTVPRALGMYRTVFVIRVGAAFVTTIAAVVVASLRHARDATLLAGAVPLASLATAVVLAISLVKLLALPRGVRARGVTIGAIVAIGLAGLLDAATLALAVYTFVESYHSRALRELLGSVFATWPAVALASGISLLFVASALGRLGEKLADDRVVGRARWVQGIAIAAGAAQIGSMLAAAAALGGGSGSSSQAGGVIALGLMLASLAAIAVVVSMHVLLVGTARSAVLAAIGELPPTG